MDVFKVQTIHVYGEVIIAVCWIACATHLINVPGCFYCKGAEAQSFAKAE
jgi:hypothetical protein